MNHEGTHEDAIAARGRAESGTAELRGECPRWILNVLDAVSMASDTTPNRTALVNSILGEWAKKKLHEASLVQRIAGVTPTLPEADRRAA